MSSPIRIKKARLNSRLISKAAIVRNLRGLYLSGYIFAVLYAALHLLIIMRDKWCAAEDLR